MQQGKRQRFSAERLREAREARGWSRRQLGDAVNVRMEAVKHWETGEHMPSMAKLEEVLTVLNCDVGDVFDCCEDQRNVRQHETLRAPP